MKAINAEDEYARGYKEAGDELVNWAKKKSDQTDDPKYIELALQFFNDRAAARIEQADAMKRFFEARKVQCPTCRVDWSDMDLAPDFHSTATFALPDTQQAVSHMNACSPDDTVRGLIESLAT